VPNLDVVVVPFDENDKTLAQSMLLVMNMLKPSVQVVVSQYFLYKYFFSVFIDLM